MLNTHHHDWLTMTLLGLLIFILIPLVSSRGLRFMSTVNALNLNKTIMNYKFLFKITSNGCQLSTTPPLNSLWTRDAGSNHRASSPRVFTLLTRQACRLVCQSVRTSCTPRQTLRAFVLGRCGSQSLRCSVTASHSGSRAHTLGSEGVGVVILKE